MCSPNCTTVSRLFSKDVTTWLFRLYWILFPEKSQLVISSLLEDIQMYFVLSSCTTVSLVDFSPEMLPPGYFVSTGGFQCICALLVHHSLPCRLFSRDVTAWLFRLYWILFPEMSQLVISSLLEVSNVFVFSLFTQFKCSVLSMLAILMFFSLGI